LQSVLEQSYYNWECLIVDDGSPDNTKEIAEAWVSKDNRFKYHFKDNGGLCSARNYGIAKAKGTFILPLDADDKIVEEYTERAIQAFENDPSLKVVYCIAEKFGAIKEPWVLPEFSLHNLSRNNMIFCSALFRKTDWQLVGGYDENMKYGWEDWEFWIAMLKDGGGVHKLDYVGFFYRIKEGSMLLEIDSEKSKIMMEYLNVKHADFFVKHYGSFKAMEHSELYLKREFDTKLKSKKFAVDVFCKRLFGFSIFGKYK